MSALVNWIKKLFNAVPLSLATWLVILYFTYTWHLPRWMFLINACVALTLVVGGSLLVYYHVYLPLKEKESQSLATRVFLGFFFLFLLASGTITFAFVLYNESRIEIAVDSILDEDERVNLRPEFERVYSTYDRYRPRYRQHDLLIHDLEVGFHVVREHGAVEHHVRGRWPQAPFPKSVPMTFFHGSNPKLVSDASDFFAVDVLDGDASGETTRCVTDCEVREAPDSLVAPGFFFHTSVPLRENGEFEILKTFCAPGSLPRQNDAFLTDLRAFAPPSDSLVVKLYSDRSLLPFFKIVRRADTGFVETTVAPLRVGPILDIPASKREPHKLRYGFRLVLKREEYDSVLLAEFYRPLQRGWRGHPL